MRLLFAAFFIFFLCISSANASGVCSRTFSFTEGGDTMKLPYCSNADITVANSQITEFQINVHGVGRNPSATSDDVLRAMIAAGRNDMVIVFPQFVEPSDENGDPFVDEYGKSTGGTLDLSRAHDDYVYWEANDWNKGMDNDTSPYSRPFKISSFEIMDQMLQRAVESYPNLQRIVFTGHSAGGQMACRYIMAATFPTRADGTKFPNSQFFFVSANPSGCTYVTSERPEQNISGPITWHEDYSSSWCDGRVQNGGSADAGNFSDADDYETELVDANSDGACDDCSSEAPYVATIPFDTLVANYRERQLWGMIGLKDDDPDLNSIDQSCPYHLLGNTRLERMVAFWEHMGRQWGWDRVVSGQQEIIYIPGVAHSASQMYTSTCGQWVLFGINGDKCDPANRTPLYERFDDTGFAGWVKTGVGDWTRSDLQRAEGDYSALSSGPATNLTLTSPSVSGSGVYTVTWGWRITSQFDPGDSLEAEVNIDGGGWTPVASLTGNVDEDRWQYASSTHSINSSIQIRFVLTTTANGDTTAGAENAWLDGVRITKREGL